VVLFVVLLVCPPLIGLVSRHRAAVVVPLLAWPIYYVGLNQDWWGANGTGDGWQALAVVLTAVGVLTTAAAVEAGQRFATRSARPS
jgi:hypothetical protein